MRIDILQYSIYVIRTIKQRRFNVSHWYSDIYEKMKFQPVFRAKA